MIETYPSESGRFYYRDGRPCETIIGTNGNSRKPTARDAAKLNIVPSVTTITKVAHKEAIQRWMVNRAIKFTSKVLYDQPREDLDEWLTDDCLTTEVWQLLNADSEAITGRGKELHAAIEKASECGTPDVALQWKEHVESVYDELQKNGIDIYLGNTEHSFATSRYGGKIDWHNDEWLLDFKTKPRIEKDKKLAYPEHAQQLAAYACGLAQKDANNFIAPRRCANVFIGIEDAEVVFHEWSEKDLLKGWRKFEALLNVWWCDYL